MSRKDSSFKKDIWLWGRPSGTFNGIGWGLPEGSSITPEKAVVYMDIDNMIMLRSYRKPKAIDFNLYMQSMKHMNKVVWSIVGDSGSPFTEEDINAVIDLKKEYGNISGVIMDDFFRINTAQSSNRLTFEEIIKIKERLNENGLPLWVVVYDYQLDLPELKEYLSLCDIITFWTWKAENLLNLERNLEQLKGSIGDKELSLGCYMWDFGDKKPISLKLMEHQCNLAFKYYEQQHLSSVIFLASAICDLNIEAVEWTRKWINDIK